MTGLVLEGGAMRGMYTAGVLDVFLREDISFQGICGVSAGAVFGINYLSRQSERAVRYSCRFNKNPRYMGFLNMLFRGELINTDFAYGTVPKKLDPFDDATYKKSIVPFYAVVTNLETGKAEYIQIKSCFAQMDALRASASMPFVSHPVSLGKGLYLDGGIADSIPFEAMEQKGYDRLVVVLTREDSYRKKPVNKALVSAVYHKYPAFVNAMTNRWQMYNKSVEKLRRLEAVGKVFVIRPKAPLGVKRMEKSPEKLQAVHREGVTDAQNNLNALRAFLLS